MEETKEATFSNLCNQAVWFHVDIYERILHTIIVFPVSDKFYPTREAKREQGTVVGYFAAKKVVSIYLMIRYVVLSSSMLSSLSM